MAERRYTIVFYAAVATAIVATFGVYRYLEQAKASNRVAMHPVVVAAQDVREGQRLDRVTLSLAQWPAGTLPESAYTNVDSVVGRVARLAVFKGEVIVPGRLAPPGTGPGLEVKIAPGKRAMAVKINDVAGISGLVQPNSRVDVLVTLKSDGAQNKQEAKLFMGNMRVLSVGTQVERGEDGKPINATSATLEVTPEEAERLAVAVNQGSIQLVLRGFGDPDSVRTPGATSADVLAQLRTHAAPSPAPKEERPRVSVRSVRRPEPEPAPAPVTPPPPAPVHAVAADRKPDSVEIRVYRGDKVSQQKFAKKDSTKTP